MVKHFPKSVLDSLISKLPSLLFPRVSSCFSLALEMFLVLLWETSDKTSPAE